MEHERLLAVLGSAPPPIALTLRRFQKVNQADHVDVIKLVEGNKAEEERKSRAAEFELRAKSVGITEEKFVAQKVAIWEGMWAAKQSGDDIGVSILYSAPFRRL